MPDSPFVIQYELTLAADRHANFTIRLHPETLRTLAPTPEPAPEWAALGFQQCPNCPLKVAACPNCPVALQLSEVVPQFAQVFSYERLDARVTVKERAYERRDLPAQVALSSLLGIFMVTSGCPVMAPLKPMVRFHLPFADELETMVRSTSMYLLGQYFVGQDGGAPDWTMQGLVEVYRATGTVNRAFAQRLRAAAPKDANVNALIRLDTFARALPDTIENQLEELRFLFRQAR